MKLGKFLLKFGRFGKLLNFCATILFLGALFAFSASAIELKDNLKIRIGLEFGPTSPETTVFASEGGFDFINFNEETYESSVIFETEQTKITIKNINGIAIVYSESGEQIYASDSNVLYFCGKNGFADYNGKTYIETMKIFCKDGLMRVINIVSFESYIKGVLPREVYPSWPDEALKSAAVAARSYALCSMNGKHSRYGVDVCDTTCCQVYGGNGSNEQPSTNAAVEATANVVLAYDGKIALTVYTSSAGDHTESAAGAWGGNEEDYPYLCGVPTEFETPESYPGGTWSSTVSTEEIFAYINSKSAYSGKLSGRIAAINVEYADNGYARKVTVTDELGNNVVAVTSANTRSILSKFVKSPRFLLTPNFLEEGSSVAVATAQGTQKRTDIGYGAYVMRAASEKPQELYPATLPLSYTISGVGFGHGVGMSQFGAMTLAQNGKTFDQILAIYYPGTYLTTLGELALAQG